MNVDTTLPPAVVVDPADEAPVRQINGQELAQLGINMMQRFAQYKSERRIAEIRWLQNMRQYLGIYDPEIEKELVGGKSKAYPRITRIKCISVLSRLMNLMFPSNERNWTVTASPSPEMSPDDIMAAVQKMAEKDQGAGVQLQLTPDKIEAAVNELAEDRAKSMELLIADQLEELGGDQTYDYINLNRRVLRSGICYGLGLLRGPFVRKTQQVSWGVDASTGQPVANVETVYKPQFEFLSVWDFYGDMSAKTVQQMDGYFLRLVMSRAQVRELANRPDFLKDQIRVYLSRNPQGNYKPETYESELKAMGVKINVNEQQNQPADSGRYEVIVWRGPVGGEALVAAGVDVPEDKRGDDIDAEIWMIDQQVIKADINGWRKAGANVRDIHAFLFDEDDTSPLGQGLPTVMRDSQMAICAATRMLLDNASVVCGPNLELNTDLLRPDQDLTSISSYKMWYREGSGPDAQQPAVRTINIDSHIPELLKIVELFMSIADAETFVGPATGGDGERNKVPGEPMRTAAGASMLRADAALPFKDIVRSFDTFTQSVISSLVVFNRLFNPARAPAGDYNIVARGASSLIAKEVRGIQIDQIAASLTDAERIHVDERKMVEARFAVRDLSGMLVSETDVARRQAQIAQEQQEAKAQQQRMLEAELRKVLSDAFKNIAQGQKNAANADETTVNTAITVLERAVDDELSPKAKAADAGKKPVSAKK